MTAMATTGGLLVHPHGLCESDEVGIGTRIWAFAHVLPGAVVGADCNICDGAFVEGGAVLGDRVTVKNGTLVFQGVSCEDEVFLGPNVLFTNDLRPRAAIRKGPGELLPTTVRRGATLGAGVVVVCGIEVGEYAFAAAGSILTRDVPAHAFVAGNPARHKGWACRCGYRLDRDLGCPACGDRYEQIRDAADLHLIYEAFAAGLRRIDTRSPAADGLEPDPRLPLDRRADGQHRRLPAQRRR